MQPGDVNQTYADISKARRQLGFEPKTTLETGLKKFVEWMRSELTDTMPHGRSG